MSEEIATEAMLLEEMRRIERLMPAAPREVPLTHSTSSAVGVKDCWRSLSVMTLGSRGYAVRSIDDIASTLCMVRGFFKLYVSSALRGHLEPL